MEEVETEPDLIELPNHNAPQKILAYRSMMEINAKQRKSVLQ